MGMGGGSIKKEGDRESPYKEGSRYAGKKSGRVGEGGGGSKAEGDCYLRPFPQQGDIGARE